MRQQLPVLQIPVYGDDSLPLVDLSVRLLYSTEKSHFVYRGFFENKSKQIQDGINILCADMYCNAM